VDDSRLIDPEEFARTFEFEPTMTTDSTAPNERPWAMFSMHGHVLILVASDPEADTGAIAERLHVSERVIRRTLDDLIAAHLVSRARVGNRSRFVITSDDPVVATLTAPRSVSAVTRLYGRTA
jgi:hypothetical protein